MFKPSLTERVRMRTAPSVSKPSVFDLHFFWSRVHAIDNDTLSYVFSPWIIPKIQLDTL